MKYCRACEIEAEIGTHEIPHPVDVRLHNCVPETLEELQARVIALCGGLEPSWLGTPADLFEQIKFWYEDSHLFQEVRVFLANPICLSDEVLKRVKDLVAENEELRAKLDKDE